MTIFFTDGIFKKNRLSLTLVGFFHKEHSQFKILQLRVKIEPWTVLCSRFIKDHKLYLRMGLNCKYLTCNAVT